MAWKGFFARPNTSSAEPARAADAQLERTVEPRQLLQAHRQRLTTLRLESGYPPEMFEHVVGALTYAVAEYVHVLPATRSEHHSEAGGLLRFALESACGAFRRADGQFLSGRPLAADVRNRERDRAWRYAGFLGALLRPLGRAFTDVRVARTEEKATVWDPYQEPLWGWMRRVGAVQVDVQWQRNDANPVQAASIWLAARILTPAALSYLHSVEGLSQTLLQLIAGEPVGRLSELVEKACQGAIDEDLARLGQRHDLVVTGVQIEHRLLEALRALVREKWTINTPGGRLWVTSEGVFLAWKAAVNDLTVRLRAEGVSNAPRDPDTIAELLTQHGVLTPNPEAVNGLKHYYRIVPQLRGAPKQSLEVVKLKDIELIGLHLEGVDAIELQSPEAAKSSAPAKPPKKGDSRSLELPWDKAAPITAPMPALPAAKRSNGVAADIVVSSSEAPAAAVVSTPAPPASSAQVEPPQEKKSFDLNRLNRFGEAGQILKALAERLLVDPQFTRMVPVKGGVVLAYPQAIAPFCSQPQSFLAACEAQGLLIADPADGRRVLRTRSSDDKNMPEQYLVLSERVARCLPLSENT